MSYARLILHLFVFGSLNVSAQWISQPVPPDVSLLLSVSFSSVDNGVASGYYTGFSGRAVRTANGGTTWELVQVPDSSRSLVSVRMFENGEGYIAGAYNSSLPVPDVSSTHSLLPGGSPAESARADYFRRIGLTEGETYGGLFLKSTDNGGTWNTWGALPESTYYLLGLSFVSLDSGWVTISTTPGVEQAEILRTTDGGMTWVVSGISDSIVSLRSVEFLDQSVGYAVGYQSINQSISGVILRTTDGGENWEQHDFPEVDNFTGVSIADDSTAYVSGVTTGGTAIVYKTTSVGKDWVPIQFSSSSTLLNGVCFAENSLIGVVYGSTTSPQFDPYAARTTDGGSSWTPAVLPMGEAFTILTGAFLLSVDTGYLVGGSPITEAAVFHTTNGGVTYISADDGPVAQEFILSQNHPNPFNPSTTINFSIPKSGEVSLKISNLLGEEVATLVSGNREAGSHTVQWDATGQPSGVYFCRLLTTDFVQTKKLVLLR